MSPVMPALVAGTHVLKAAQDKNVDGRDEPGHDEGAVVINRRWNQ
jgi:hypothetical protein